MTPNLIWYGHSCFKLDFGTGGSVIFDPYAKGSVPGAELPDVLSADMVLCSHGHGDHNAADRVTLSGKTPAFSVKGLDTFHDPEKGKLRGPNRISIVEYEGFRAAHLGDLGCALTEEEIAALSGVDLLLIPVGGHFTIDPAEAVQVLAQVQPKAAVPMHYRRGRMGFPIISALEDFLALAGAYTEVKSNTLELDGKASGVIVMNL